MKIVIDRIEENIVVIEMEDGSIVNIPRAFFKEEILEGRSYNVELTLLAENKDIKNKFESLFKS